MARGNTSKVKKVRPQLTTCQKAACRAKFIALTDDVNSARTTYMDQVQVLAKKHGHSEHWTRCQLYLGGQTVRRSQRPNAWNAFVHQRLDDINEGLSKGNRWKLTEFIESHKETLCNDYARLSRAQRNNYKVEIIKMRADKQCMVHDNPRVVQRDMQATFAAMDQELFAPTSVLKAFMWLSVVELRTLVVPNFFSEKAEKFVRAVLDLEPRRLALKLEAFAVSGLAEDIPTISREKKSLNQLVSECRTLIQDELVQNPSSIGGCKSVQLLINRLIEETCKWTKLTEEELADRITSNHARQAAGETVYKPRKMRTKKTVEKSAAIVESSSESDENEGDDGDNE
ncbi:uncharacterized protein HD556DRAFT_1451008 [Suillus plorans]|uniref:Uncharacterized protein n=1 Tax=Suillus plorans TaxID=116603 RepID=A0A9P7AAI5_9AGAM|nr:uncharacterized protein HD556DRAFT_1451008 [Suillus plorans]KAG1785113.1 hypothetical protein HD556DRAFT_1451008 [Suillus plorans]